MTMPLKVLFFAHALQGRGTERALIRLLHEFDRSLISPELAVVAAEGDFLHRVPSDVPLHDLDLAGKRTSRALPRLEALLRRLNPDCTIGVHISAGRALSILRMIRPRLPIICMEADPFTRIEGEKGHFRVRTAASRMTYRLATHVVAASDVVAADLTSHLGVRSDKITLIPLPSVDDDLHRLAEEPLDEPFFNERADEPMIINVGNMYAHKDQATLLRAFKIVNDSIRARLTIVGEGELRGSLATLVNELQIAERVWFAGFQSNPFKLLARADVFASSSVAEGFDISQIEAMACRLPVIVTDGPRFHAVKDGLTGLVVPAAQPQPLAGAILRVLQSPQLAGSLGGKAAIAAAEFHVSRIARRWEALIRAVAGN